MTSCGANRFFSAEYSLPPKPFLGVFDSGVGGLSVLARFLDRLPGENYVYVGDSCHAPYGDRTPAELFELGGSISLWLKDKGAKAIVLACNTISSTLIAEIRSLLAPLPVYSILEAGVMAAVLSTKSQKIGIIATATTTNSQSFAKGIRDHLPEAELTSVACPAFVPLVEKGLVATQEAAKAVEEICSHFSGKNIDTLLLGCTHYPALIPLFRKHLHEDVMIVDPAEYYAEMVAADLYQAQSLHGKIPAANYSDSDLSGLDSYSEVLSPANAQSSDFGKRIFLTTGDHEQFKESGTLLFGRVPDPVFRIDYSEIKVFSPLSTARGLALAKQITK